MLLVLNELVIVLVQQSSDVCFERKYKIRFENIPLFSSELQNISINLHLQMNP